MITNFVSKPSTREWTAVFGLLVCCWFCNAATCRLYPAAWCDEVWFADPAINFVQTGSFITRVWPYQPTGTFPAVNCPLYSMSLAAWLSAVGTSLLAARTFNYLLAGGVAFLAWLGSWWLGLLKRPVSRVALVLLVELGYGLSTAFRSIRPDLLGAVFLLLLVLSFGIEHHRWRAACMMFVAAAIVWTGLQVALAASFACFAGWVLLPRVSFKDLVSVALGMILGALLLILFLAQHQALSNFILTVSIITDRSASAQFSTAFLPAVWHLTLKNLHSYVDDLSLLPILAGTILWIVIGRQHPRGGRRPAGSVFLLLLVLLVPFLLNVVGHYVIFYSYMVFLPACLLFLSLYEKTSETSGVASRRWSGVAFALIVCASLGLGLPLRLGLAEMFCRANSHEQTNGVLRQYLRPGDVVLADYQAFFDVKEITPVVYVQRDAERTLSPEERNTVSVLVVSPKGKDSICRWLGGRWEVVSQPFGDSIQMGRAGAMPVIGRKLASYFSQQSSARCHLEILRRSTESSTP
jgi:hypothetical protein